MIRTGGPVFTSAERILAIAAMALLVLAHIELRRHIGPLWRDEVNTVNVAKAPSLHELWSGLEFDSFPIVAPLVVRAAVRLFGSSDEALRTLGLFVGLSLLSALWWSVRTISHSLPILSLALLSGSTAVLRSGDSLRGYGIGSIFILITFGLFWRVIEKISVRSVALALLFSVLSAQSLYQNATLLLAAGSGGVAAGIVRKSWKLPVIFVAIGLVDALSLLPYAPLIARARNWNVLLQWPIGLRGIGAGFAECLGLSGSPLIWIWIAIFASALTACGYLAVVPAAGGKALERERAAFLGVAGFAGAAGYAVFFRTLGYIPRAWHYVPAIVFLAATLDTAIDLFLRCRPVLRVARIIAASSLIMVNALHLWSTLRVRQTGVDRAAMKVQELASKDDLVVVNTWEYGISFMRYYRGLTPWTTLPALSDHRTHRYDLIKQAMLDPGAVEAVLEDVTKVLRSGHSVWLVGHLQYPPPVETRPMLPPPPSGEQGWRAGPYMGQWSEQLSRLLRNHSLTWRLVPWPPSEPINPFESPQILVFQGWKD